MSTRTALLSKPRRGAILVLSALLMIAMLAMAALAIDVGYMLLVKTQLQVAADAGALAAGNSLHLTPAEVIAVGADYATRHDAGGRKIRADEVDVELGIWDAETDTFNPAPAGNAVKVTAKRGGEALFFAKAIGHKVFDTEASAIAMANPKDIVFVVDLSGSMNDDTEPAWATKTVNAEFGPAGFPTIGNDLMQDVYADFGFGTFPGDLEYVGAPAGVKKDSYAYANLTSDIGPLASPSVGSKYRIKAGDNEKKRKEQAYKWMIDNQLAKLMPDARPKPSSDDLNYWEKYLDYVILSRRVKTPQPPKPPAPPKPPTPPGGGGSSGGGSGGGGGGTPTPPTPPPPPKPPKPPIGGMFPAPVIEGMEGASYALFAILGQGGPAPAFTLRGTVYGAAGSGPGLPRVGGLNGKSQLNVPVSQDGDRIHKFNNPNKSSFPKAKNSLPRNLRNYLGYLTYTQFLMDHGRNLRPNGKQHVELSMDSGLCPMHKETVAGRSFDFPPRTQPMHAARRSVISAIDVVDERNGSIPSPLYRDRVAIVTFDSVKGSQVRQGLTAEYNDAMLAVTRLQAVGDKSTTTATESGLALAKELLKPESEGGKARDYSTRLAVLLTDGMPNAFESSAGSIDTFAGANPDGEFYGGGLHWYDAPLMQTMQLQANRVDTHPVGVGLGTDYDFMDRVARLGGTADALGQSPRGSGNPAEYEARMVEIFEKIIKKPVAKLVE